MKKHLDTFKKLVDGKTVIKEDIDDAEIWNLKRRVRSLEEAVECLLKGENSYGKAQTNTPREDA